MAEGDTRRVQTAVIGTVDSDRPVTLPEIATNLDAFRMHYQDVSFWCGTLLGGCGGELLTKRYEDKICHFAHKAGPDGTRPPCDRADNSTASADHLFIKQQVSAWLDSQNVSILPTLRRRKHAGDAVDFWLRDAGQHLRFQLEIQGYREWYHEDIHESIEWIYTPDDPLLHDALARHGYALCVRCHTPRDGERRVQIGTLSPTDVIQWAELSDCVLKDQRILTPTLQRLRQQGRVREETPAPATLPLRGAELHFAIDPDGTPPAQSPLVTEGRYLITADVKPAGSRIIRAHISLPDSTPTPTEQYVYQLSGVARLLLTDALPEGTAEWAILAEGLTPLHGTQAERTGLWRPQVAVGQPPPRTAPQPAAPPQQPQRTKKAGTRDDKRSPQAIPTRSKAAVQLRQALLHTAASGQTVTWDKLAEQTDLPLRNLPDPQRRALLVEVDRPAPPGTSLLTVLVRGRNGKHLPYFGTVLRMLQVEAPMSTPALERWCLDQIRRTHRAYGYSAAAPATSSASHPTGVTASPPYQDAAQQDAQDSNRELRAAVNDAQRFLTETTAGPPRFKRLKAALREAEVQLATYNKLRAATPGQLLSCTTQMDAVRTAIRRQLHNAQRQPVPPQRQHPEQSDTREDRPSRSAQSERTIRAVLEGLRELGDNAATLRLRSDLARVKTVKRHIPGPLPEDLQTLVQECQQRLDVRMNPPAHAPEPAPEEAASAGTETDETSRLGLEKLSAFAAPVRQVLQETARNQTTTTWHGLRDRLPKHLPQLHPDYQGEVLVQADRDTPAGEPLLSALVTTNDGSLHPLYHHIAYSLERAQPTSEREATATWQMDVLRLHQSWRHR